jgi:cbb3-type cytochrome oxidase maturation protein
MSVMAILLVISISVALLFLLAFIWSLKTGQFEDDFSPPRRILFDESPAKPASSSDIQENKNLKTENQ